MTATRKDAERKVLDALTQARTAQDWTLVDAAIIALRIILGDAR